jgi:hypothetical protein
MHETQFAEVYYYFRLLIGGMEKTLAMVSTYSAPHQHLFELSYRTLWSCTHGGDSSLMVIDVKSIEAVIAMVPHQPFPDLPGRYFLVEKPGLAIAFLSGHVEDIPDEE